MDSFDHEENAIPRTEHSHDTVLMLFKNGNNTLENATVQISQIPISLFSKKRKLEHIIHCQKIIRSGKFSGSGLNPTTFPPSHCIDHTIVIDTSSAPYKT